MDYNYVLDVQHMACEARYISDNLFNDWYNHIQNNDEHAQVKIKAAKNELRRLKDMLETLLSSIENELK